MFNSTTLSNTLQDFDRGGLPSCALSSQSDKAQAIGQGPISPLNSFDFQELLKQLKTDLDDYVPSVCEGEEIDNFLREQYLRANAGLSTVHFSPTTSSFSTVDFETGEVILHRYIAFREFERGPVITTYVPLASNRSAIQGAKLIWRDGGNVVSVQRSKTNLAYDKDQSSPVLKISPVDGVEQEIKRGGNDTSPLSTFSRSSRRRFMRQLASVRVDVNPVFITLTYPDQFPESPKRWKRDLDVFGKRFERKFSAGFAWRMELKRRQSGENEGKIAPHFHLLTWGCSFSELKDWVGQSWYEVVGSGDERHLRAGTRVERVRSVRGVMWYASKYMAKVEKLDLSDCPSVGRLWGFVGRERIPWADLLEQAISECDAVKMLRWMRKCAHIPSRDYQSLTIFGDGRQWLDCYNRLC